MMTVPSYLQDLGIQKLVNPDTALSLAQQLCDKAWDSTERDFFVSVDSDQWIGFTMGCEHGSYTGVSEGWEEYALTHAATHSLYLFKQGHTHAI